MDSQIIENDLSHNVIVTVNVTTRNCNITLVNSFPLKRFGHCFIEFGRTQIGRRNQRFASISVTKKILFEL